MGYAAVHFAVIAALLLFSTNAKAAGLNFQCYGTEYVADPKEFQASKIGEAGKGVFPPGVFQHTGGGPNGSHWNLSGMRDGLFCVAEVPASGDGIRSIHVKAGPTNLPVQAKKEEMGENRSLLSFSIPFEAIRRAARKIERADLPLLYDDRKEEIALYLKNGTWNSTAPPNEGDLIEITVGVLAKNGRGHVLRGMIHAAYGE